MRIIAGEFRGRKLLPPEGDVTRPITDRVKQSLFDILTPQIEGAVVFDLFSGTGSMGLECLSRGASRVEFFEADRSAISRLKQNLSTLDIPSTKAVVHSVDLFQWFQRGRSDNATQNPAMADLLFLDPPYRFLRERTADLQRLAEQLAATWLAPKSTLVFRHDAVDQLELPSLQRYDLRTYGGMTLELLTVGSAQADA